MGTSSYQRSPRTAEWDAVNRAYDSPGAGPVEVLTRIVAALDEPFREGLSDPAAQACLATVLQAADRLSGPLEAAEQASLAGELRQQAERAIEEAKARSRFGDLALDGVVQTVMKGGGPSRDALARTFVAQYLGRAVSYLASRDIASHVGGPRLGTSADAARFVAELEEACEATVGLLDFAALAEADGEALGPALATAVDKALRALAEGARHGE